MVRLSKGESEGGGESEGEVEGEGECESDGEGENAVLWCGRGPFQVTI